MAPDAPHPVKARTRKGCVLSLSFSPRFLASIILLWRLMIKPNEAREAKKKRNIGAARGLRRVPQEAHSQGKNQKLGAPQPLLAFWPLQPAREGNPSSPCASCLRLVLSHSQSGYFAPVDTVSGAAIGFMLAHLDTYLHTTLVLYHLHQTGLLSLLHAGRTGYR